MTRQQRLARATQDARIRLAAARAARELRQQQSPLDPADAWAETYHYRLEGGD